MKLHEALDHILWLAKGGKVSLGPEMRDEAFDLVEKEMLRVAPAPPRQFYVTDITFAVVSDKPIDSKMTLHRIATKAEIGTWACKEGRRRQVTLTGKQVAAIADDYDFPPCRFDLDENGNDLDGPGTLSHDEFIGNAPKETSGSGR